MLTDTEIVEIHRLLLHINFSLGHQDGLEAQGAWESEKKEMKFQIWKLSEATQRAMNAREYAKEDMAICFAV